MKRKKKKKTKSDTFTRKRFAVKQKNNAQKTNDNAKHQGDSDCQDKVRRENEHDFDRRGKEIVAADRYPELVKGCVVDQGLGRLWILLRRRFAMSNMKKKKKKKKTKPNDETLRRKRLAVEQK